MRSVDVLVPVKMLDRAKTRLVGAADDGGGDPGAHRRLVLALARDTLAAAAAAPVVGQLVVICSDPVVATALTGDAVAVVADEPEQGLNAALRHGEAVLARAGRPAAAVAALHADLPALRPGELDEALRCALDAGHRAFCPDRSGSGTTLLVAPDGHALDPRFGTRSAHHHSSTGARQLSGSWPGLRCDVDTETDLAAAGVLGLGRHTRRAVRAAERTVRTAGHMRNNRWA